MFHLLSLLACAQTEPTPQPVPPPPAGEWMPLALPPGAPGGTMCWAWRGVDPLCRWGDGPVPPPPPKADATATATATDKVEAAPAAETK